jgi:hypothetical protein
VNAIPVLVSLRLRVPDLEIPAVKSEEQSSGLMSYAWTAALGVD